MVKKDVLIIGAGISGLVAGRELARAGRQVGIVEALDRTGGRILSIHRHGVTAEAGPEFIHGHLQETMSLLNAYQIPFIKTAGRMYVGRAGQFTDRENEDHWSNLLEKMTRLTSDMPLQDFLDKHFAGEAYHSLRQWAIRFAAGFDLADARTVSTLSLLQEWKHEESVQYRIPGGYGQLTSAITRDFLEAGGALFLNTAVARVEWIKQKVDLITAGEQFHAGKLLVTCPAGVMTHKEQTGYSLAFVPEIHFKRQALEKIGFGAVIKIILFWKMSFWNDLVTDLQFILTEQEVPTWWTQNPLDSGVLVGWIGGPPADDLSSLTDQELLNLALDNLSVLFGIPRHELNEKLAGHQIFNWRTAPYARGGYSFELVGGQDAKKIWKSSVDDTLYFAGEACYEGPDGGTVEAAIVSGLDAARHMII